MTFEEIMEAGSGAAEQRITRMKANAKAQKDKASQMKKQADARAEVWKLRQSRQRAAKARKTSVGKNIKPYK